MLWDPGRLERYRELAPRAEAARRKSDRAGTREAFQEALAKGEAPEDYLKLCLEALSPP